MFLQNIFELSVPGEVKSFDCTYTLHHVLLHRVWAVGTRGSGGSGGLSPPFPPQILAGIEAKPSPSKGLGLLFAPHPNGFSYLPTALQVWLQQAISQWTILKNAIQNTATLKLIFKAKEIKQVFSLIVKCICFIHFEYIVLHTTKPKKVKVRHT